jgi:hypothetical protein
MVRTEAELKLKALFLHALALAPALNNLVRTTEYLDFTDQHQPTDSSALNASG